MERVPEIKNEPTKEESKELALRSIEKEKLEEIMKEYEQDPDNFYKKNAFELWDGDKNPALMVSVEMCSHFIQEIWDEKGLGKSHRIITEARNIAMFVMKYLGADIEGWCKVDPRTAIEVNQKMGELDFQENGSFILEKIKKNDPIFSEFLTKISVKDNKTGELRNDGEMVAIVTMINVVVRTMYEQMRKNAKIN